MPEEVVKRGRGRPRKNPIPEEQVDVSAKVVSETEQPVTEAVFVDTPVPLKVYIFPKIDGKPVGGIPRVVEAQVKHLPKFGIEIVDKEDDADVIVCHITIPAEFIKRFPRKPIVVINHGLMWGEYEWDKNWHTQVNKDAMEAIRVADTVITCSEWVANSIRRHTSRHVEIVNHGIDYDEWQSGMVAKDYVLWNKFRVDAVCDPMPLNQVAFQMPNQKFVSTFGDKLPNIALTGELKFEDSKKLIQQAGVYLCTTRETFGIGTLEAMACGVPVVGFNYGGQAEFIEHKVDGWLAQPGDINGLAEGIQWALANRDVVGAAARRKAKAYNWERFAEQYAKIFYETYEKKNKQGPRTSIIVTNYQLHDYLGECLKSVQNQTDQDWECIVVDDASPNAWGREIVHTFTDEDHRFKLVSNEKNVYLAEARNVGIRLANGRYILPLDADDMLAPNAVALLADSLDNDRSVHAAYGGVFFVDEDGVTPTDYSEWYGGNKSPYPPGKSSWPFQFTHEQQIQQMNLMPYCSMYRKEAWEQTGGYRRRCRTAEDADMWTRFSSYGFRPKMVTNDDTLIYRNREGSMSRTNSTEWIRWFSWTKMPNITPAGAITKEQLSIPSLDPCIISVIIPVGPGHEKLVTDAIDSVDTQSFRNWECIVVNDTDKPLPTELPAWVRVIDWKVNQPTGVAAARNRGIAASKGRLFIPLDADDYLEPDALQFMYDAYVKNPGVVYSDFWQSDSTGKKVTVHHCDDYDPRFITGGRRTFEGVQREGMIHTVTALTPKWAWEKVGGYDETLPAWEDWDFQIALGNIGVCSQRVSLPLFFYRKHTGFRREDNYEFFERSKAGILAKWGDLWEGKKELMACGACQRARAAGITTGQGVWAAQSVKPIDTGEAELIRYNGDKEGSISYRGPSKTMYLFGKGDIKFVLKEDVAMFMQYAEFEVVPQEVSTPAMTGSAPILQAQGQA